MKGNFFDRLAARTMGLASVSQPILPAKFSPVPRTSIAPEPFAGTSEQVAAPVATPAPLSTPLVTQFRTIPTSNHDGAGIPESDSPPSNAARQDAPPGMNAFRLRERAPSSVVSEVSAFTLPLPEPPPIQRLGVPRDSGTAITPDIIRQRPSSPAQPVTAQGMVSSAAGPSVQDSVHHVSEQNVNNNLQSASEAAAPVLRVTIGRVDVRAQFPAAPAPQPLRRSRDSSISLDEYLKQRSGGRR